MLPKVAENLRKSVKLKMKVVGVIALLSINFTGCASKLTLFTPPGKIDHQRDRAVLVDPFALPNMGSEIPELRPREYSAPLDEARRAQLYSEMKRSLGNPTYGN